MNPIKTSGSSKAITLAATMDNTWLFHTLTVTTFFLFALVLLI